MYTSSEMELHAKRDQSHWSVECMSKSPKYNPSRQDCASQDKYTGKV